MKEKGSDCSLHHDQKARNLSLKSLFAVFPLEEAPFSFVFRKSHSSRDPLSLY